MEENQMRIFSLYLFIILITLLGYVETYSLLRKVPLDFIQISPEVRSIYTISIVSLVPIIIVLVIAYFFSNNFRAHLVWAFTFVILTYVVVYYLYIMELSYLIYGGLLIMLVHILNHWKYFYDIWKYYWTNRKSYRKTLLLYIIVNTISLLIFHQLIYDYLDDIMQYELTVQMPKKDIEYALIGGLLGTIPTTVLLLISILYAFLTKKGIMVHIVIGLSLIGVTVFGYLYIVDYIHLHNDWPEDTWWN
jgi:hypothetical protein